MICFHSSMPNELQWTEFDPEDAPSVLTADLCEAFGGCDKCHGFTHAAEVEPEHPDPEAIVFCVHWRHNSVTKA